MLELHFVRYGDLNVVFKKIKLFDLQIFLVSDLLYAYLRREYDLYHGTEHKNADGTKAVIILE